jgi:hypothetical protein
VTFAMATPAQRGTETERHFGKYRGRVTDNGDPRNLGRLRATVPEVLGNVETGWALPATPYAGNQTGIYTVPPKDAGVWIEFEAGDVSRPIWSGCWWAGDKVPRDRSNTAVSPSVRITRSEEGLMLALDDGAQSIAVSDRDGSNLLLIEVRPGTVTVKATSKVVVDAPQIELVANASHPLVFGDSLLQYLNQLVALFNAHVHPGQVAAGAPVTPAPPQPFLTPATASLLSFQVKTG